MCILFVDHKMCSNNSTLCYSFLLYIYVCMCVCVLVSLQTAKLHIIHSFIYGPFSQSLISIPNIMLYCFKLILLFSSNIQTTSRGMRELHGILVLIHMRMIMLLIHSCIVKIKDFAIRMNNTNIKIYLSYRKILSLTYCPISPHFI